MKTIGEDYSSFEWENGSDIEDLEKAYETAQRFLLKWREADKNKHRSLDISGLKTFLKTVGDGSEESIKIILELLGSKSRHGERIAFAEVFI